MWAWVLFGCAEPLSNAIFDEDERFLGALPGESRLGFPERWRVWADAPTQEVVLVEAQRAMRELDTALRAPLAVGAVLRSSEPTTRSVSHREWAPRAMTAPGGAGVWVRALVTRSGEGAPLTWTIEAAEAADAAWAVVGEGRVDADGFGAFDWDAGAWAALGGASDEVGSVSVVLSGAEAEAERGATFEVVGADGQVQRYRFEGAWGFGWDAVLHLDAQRDPEVVTLDGWIGPDGAGAARGLVRRADGQGHLVWCWNPTGVQVWASPVEPSPPALAGACAPRP